MHIGNLHELTRRTLLKRSGQLALLGGAGAYGVGLSGLSEAAALTGSDEYRALVCVFLLGGNDHSNTLIPFDPDNHAAYSAIRGRVAIERARLSETTLPTPGGVSLTDGQELALSPSMRKMRARYIESKLAFLLNVGPLETPLTRAQYESSNHTSFPRPAQLFSHNDQQATWQSSKPEGTLSGWGGRIADIVQSANSNAMFTAISATGNGVFLQGNTSIPYRISPDGAPRFKGLRYNNVYGSPSAARHLETILRNSAGPTLAADYTQVNARAIEYGKFVEEILSRTSLPVEFEQSEQLSSQLAIVAKLIAARQEIGVKRQVFVVTMGGYDSHSGLIGTHEAILAKLDHALDTFYRATVNLGVEDQVTTFTASDFGRTLETNGDGSEHGWGGHHFILGGAVKGGAFYGRAPHISTSTGDQIGRGRLLPTTSVDEYSATLARWMGVAQSDLQIIAPNLGRFATSNLGFMK